MRVCAHVCVCARVCAQGVFNDLETAHNVKLSSKKITMYLGPATHYLLKDWEEIDPKLLNMPLFGLVLIFSSFKYSLKETLKMFSNKF